MWLWMDLCTPGDFHNVLELLVALISRSKLHMMTTLTEKGGTQLYCKPSWTMSTSSCMKTYVGWPGSVHYAGILLTSEVFIKGESGTLLPSGTQQNLWCRCTSGDIVRSCLPFTSLAN